MVNVDQHAEQTGVRCFLAVQQNTAASYLDWGVFYGWKEGDPGVAGVITVKNENGAQVGRAEWAAPCDAAADPAEIRLTLESRCAAGDTRMDVVADGDAALACLRQEPPYRGGPRPGLVLLNLKLPSVDGRYVFTAITTDPTSAPSR